MTDQSSWLPIGSILTAMVLWASAIVMFKYAVMAYPLWLVVFGAQLVASLCFLTLAGRFRGIRYRKGDWKALGLLALFEPCLYNIFAAWALTQTTASQGGMMEAMQPLMVAIAGYLILKEHISRRNMIGFLLAIAGAVWLSAGSRASEWAPAPALGNLLYLAAMACSTGYTITLKKLCDRYPSVFLTALQAVSGVFFFLPFVLFTPSAAPLKFELVPILVIVYLGVVSVFGAYGLYNYGVSRIPASRAAAFINLLPVFTVILGGIFLDERFTAEQYAASVLVFLGVYLSQNRRAPSSACLTAEAHSEP